MNPLKAEFVKLPANPRTHQGVRLKVILKNTGKSNLSVLTWNTPLDKVLSDCVHVTVNGKKIEYDGPLVKRAAPTADDYITIKAGESVTTEFPLSDVYDTSRPGKYDIKLKTHIPDVVLAQAPFAAAMKAGAHQTTVQPIPAKMSFKMEKGDAGYQTLGAKARNEERAASMKMSAKPVSRKKKSPSAVPMTPLTTGGTAPQKSTAVKSHTDGYALCVAALGGLANNAQYGEWFGAHTITRFNTVKANYMAVKRRMETIQFTYNLTGTGCQPNVFAYTYKGTSTIWFCSAYWAAPATGTDSKAGTVLHEHTHSDSYTDDIVYGQTGCRNLARTKPDQAIHNADTHEYYAGG